MDFKEFFEKDELLEGRNEPDIMVLSAKNYDGITFSSYCFADKKTTTFRSNVSQLELEKFTSKKESPVSAQSIKERGGFIPKSLTTNNGTEYKITENMYHSINKNEKNIDFSFTINCYCQDCGKNTLSFLINIKSSLPYKKNQIGGDEVIYKDDLSDFIVTKMGIYPEQKVELNKLVQKFLDRESQGWYFRANKCMKQGLGVGAYAYFRRILEKELMHIVEHVKNINSEKSKEIDKLIAEYNAGNKKAHILYDGVFQYLPASLTSLGHNPIKVLYSSTSKGLHELTEEECMNTSKEIKFLFDLVIEKLYEERDRTQKAKSILKELSSL